MTLAEFIDAICADGIEAVKRDYSGNDPVSRAKRDGAIQGFLACRNKTPAELKSLLAEEHRKTENHRRGLSPESKQDMSHYWYQRCKEAEIEWVCGCVSVVLNNEGGEPISGMTARQVIHTARVLKKGKPAEPARPS